MSTTEEFTRMAKSLVVLRKFGLLLQKQRAGRGVGTPISVSF